MAKSNPLFVDSTVLHGDRISTQIEITHILLYEDESISVFLTNHLNEKSNVTMKMSDDGNFHARVWLSHQKPIRYRFQIEKRGVVLWQSESFEARAQYAIIERWQPEGQASPTVEKPVLREPEPAPKPAARPESRSIQEVARPFSSLMEKWGL